MKLIIAYVQPFKLGDVTRALQDLPEFPGLSVADVNGFGQQKAAEGKHKTVEDLIDYAKKVKIETVVPDERMEEVRETILRAAHTGNKGDGKIFVLDVEIAVRVRTGETGRDALWSPLGDPERFHDRPEAHRQ
ncbi:MAG: P-II family nitrogen regulator [Gemmatimonadota bacterium]